MNVSEARTAHKRARAHLQATTNRLANVKLDMPLYEHPDYLEACDAWWKTHIELTMAYGERR